MYQARLADNTASAASWMAATWSAVSFKPKLVATISNARNNARNADARESLASSRNTVASFRCGDVILDQCDAGTEVVVTSVEPVNG